MARHWGVYIKGAILGAITTGFALYFADSAHPAVAGVLATIPIALPSVIFMQEGQVQDFIFSVGIGVFSYVLALGLFYHLYIVKSWSIFNAMVTAMSVWIVMAILTYCLFTDGPYSLNLYSKGFYIS